MKVYAQHIPDNSLILKTLPVIHYSDCYSCIFTSKEKIEIADSIQMLLVKWPWWVNCLFWIRGIAVFPFSKGRIEIGKLKKNVDAKSNLTPGSNLLFFKIRNLTSDEIVLTASGKHLDGNASIMLNSDGDQYQIFFSTIVQFQSIVGKAYFFCIKPFHKLIVKSFLRNFIKHLN